MNRLVEEFRNLSVDETKDVFKEMLFSITNDKLKIMEEILYKKSGEESIRFQEGYESGHEDGYENGFENGLETGSADGYDEGHEEGYEAGLKEGRNGD